MLVTSSSSSSTYLLHKTTQDYNRKIRKNWHKSWNAYYKASILKCSQIITQLSRMPSSQPPPRRRPSPAAQHRYFIHDVALQTWSANILILTFVFVLCCTIERWHTVVFVLLPSNDCESTSKRVFCQSTFFLRGGIITLKNDTNTPVKCLKGHYSPYENIF